MLIAHALILTSVLFSIFPFAPARRAIRAPPRTIVQTCTKGGTSAVITILSLLTLAASVCSAGLAPPLCPSDASWPPSSGRAPVAPAAAARQSQCSPPQLSLACVPHAPPARP